MAKLNLSHPGGTAFVRPKVDIKEKARIVSFFKLQNVDLTQSLMPVRYKLQPVRDVVKRLGESFS